MKKIIAVILMGGITAGCGEGIPSLEEELRKRDLAIAEARRESAAKRANRPRQQNPNQAECVSKYMAYYRPTTPELSRIIIEACGVQK